MTSIARETAINPDNHLQSFIEVFGLNSGLGYALENSASAFWTSHPELAQDMPSALELRQMFEPVLELYNKSTPEELRDFLKQTTETIIEPDYLTSLGLSKEDQINFQQAVVPLLAVIDDPSSVEKMSELKEKFELQGKMLRNQPQSSHVSHSEHVLQSVPDLQLVTPEGITNTPNSVLDALTHLSFEVANNGGNSNKKFTIPSGLMRALRDFVNPIPPHAPEEIEKLDTTTRIRAENLAKSAWTNKGAALILYFVSTAFLANGIGNTANALSSGELDVTNLTSGINLLTLAIGLGWQLGERGLSHHEQRKEPMIWIPLLAMLCLDAAAIAIGSNAHVDGLTLATGLLSQSDTIKTWVFLSVKAGLSIAGAAGAEFFDFLASDAGDALHKILLDRRRNPAFSDKVPTPAPASTPLPHSEAPHPAPPLSRPKPLPNNFHMPGR